MKIYELGTTLAASLPCNQAGALPAERLTTTTAMMTRLAVWDCDTVLVTLNFFPHSLSGRPEEMLGEHEARVAMELIRTAGQISRRMCFRPELSGR